MEKDSNLVLSFKNSFEYHSLKYYKSTKKTIFFKLCFSWDNKIPGANVIMYEMTGDAKYKSLIDAWKNVLKSTPHTPKGMIHINQWGSARHATNAGF